MTAVLAPTPLRPSALRLLGRRRLDTLKRSELAQALGMSVPEFNRRFVSVEHAFLSHLDSRLSEAVARTRARLAETECSSDELLFDFLLAILDDFRSRGQLAAHLLPYDLAWFAGCGFFLARAAAQVAEATSEILTRGQQRGELTSWATLPGTSLLGVVVWLLALLEALSRKDSADREATLRLLDEALRWALWPFKRARAERT